MVNVFYSIGICSTNIIASQLWSFFIHAIEKSFGVFEWKFLQLYIDPSIGNTLHASGNRRRTQNLWVTNSLLSFKQNIVIFVKANMKKVEIVEDHQSMHEQNQRNLVFLKYWNMMYYHLTKVSFLRCLRWCFAFLKCF